MAGDWMYGLSGTVVGWLVGLLQAGAAQDRDKVLRYRAVARALSADVHRIMAEMGDREGGPFFTSIHGHVAKVPQVEEWLRGLTTEAAGADPAILTLFLELGRELHNFQGFETTLEKHRAKATEDRALVEQARERQRTMENGEELPELEPREDLELPKPPPFPDVTPEDLEAMRRGFTYAMSVMNLEYAARTIEERIEDIELMQDSARGRIWAKLDALEAHLIPLADVQVPSLLLFALSRIPPFPPEAPPEDWILYARGVVPPHIRVVELEILKTAAATSKQRREERVKQLERRRARR